MTLETTLINLIGAHGLPKILETLDALTDLQVVTRTRIVRKDGEYIVRAYAANGTRIPDADYFTDCRHDAESTAEAMKNPALAQIPLQAL